jgi:hypothetical protein
VLDQIFKEFKSVIISDIYEGIRIFDKSKPICLDRSTFFCLGCNNLIIAVDCKPLLKILGDRSLVDIPNARLGNLKEGTQRYKFQMVHIPGVRHNVADSVSRHPTGPPNPDILVFTDDIAATSDSTISFPLN